MSDILSRIPRCSTIGSLDRDFPLDKDQRLRFRGGGAPPLWRDSARCFHDRLVYAAGLKEAARRRAPKPSELGSYLGTNITKLRTVFCSGMRIGPCSPANQNPLDEPPSKLRARLIPRSD